MQDRIKTAVEFLKEGQSFRVGELLLGADRSGVLVVTGWCQHSNLKNLTKEIASKEMKEIKELFAQMVALSPELKSFIQEMKTEFNLYFDDYGKGSVSVCSEKNGEISWDYDFAEGE